VSTGGTGAMCTDDGAAMEAALTAVTVNAAALAARKRWRELCGASSWRFSPRLASLVHPFQCRWPGYALTIVRGNQTDLCAPLLPNWRPHAPARSATSALSESGDRSDDRERPKCAQGVAEGLRLLGKWPVTRKSDVPVSFQSLKQG